MKAVRVCGCLLIANPWPGVNVIKMRPHTLGPDGNLLSYRDHNGLHDIGERNRRYRRRGIAVCDSAAFDKYSWSRRHASRLLRLALSSVFLSELIISS